MLSREQLGDIINCYSITCGKCSFNDMCNVTGTNTAEEAAQTALKLMDQVEAQQQEVEELKQQLRYTEGAMESEAFDNRQLRKEVEQLQSDLEECQQALCVEVGATERLETQNAAYKEVIRILEVVSNGKITGN